MDSTTELGTNPNIPFDEEKRKRQIDQIVEKDHRAFQEWADQTGQNPRLDIPPEALRYLVVPRRVLELAQDPSQVRLVTIVAQEDEARVLIVEDRNKPVSDPESLHQHLDTLKKFHDAERARQHSEGRRVYVAPKKRPVRPSNVDQEHVRYRDLIEAGTLTVNDYVTNHVGLRRETNPQTLYVSHYDDRTEIRGKGVATDFYKRLPEAAKKIGFRFLVGWNEERNVGFFVDKLGRTLINDIRPEDRSLFGATDIEIRGEQEPGEFIRTVQFLYPEDKGQYLQATTQVPI